MKRRRTDDTKACDAIAATMHQQPWNTDTLLVIAAILRSTARPITEQPRP